MVVTTTTTTTMSFRTARCSSTWATVAGPAISRRSRSRTCRPTTSAIPTDTAIRSMTRIREPRRLARREWRSQFSLPNALGDGRQAEIPSQGPGSGSALHRLGNLVQHLGRLPPVPRLDDEVAEGDDADQVVGAVQ